MNSQKFDTSSLQGQKQLIDLGKTLENAVLNPSNNCRPPGVVTSP